MQDARERQTFSMLNVGSERNPADVLTKAVSCGPMARHLEYLGCWPVLAECRPTGAKPVVGHAYTHPCTYHRLGITHRAGLACDAAERPSRIIPGSSMRDAEIVFASYVCVYVCSCTCIPVFSCKRVHMYMHLFMHV